MEQTTYNLCKYLHNFFGKCKGEKTGTYFRRLNVDLISQWKFIKALFEINKMWAKVNEAGTYDSCLNPQLQKNEDFHPKS